MTKNLNDLDLKTIDIHLTEYQMICDIRQKSLSVQRNLISIALPIIIFSVTLILQSSYELMSGFESVSLISLSFALLIMKSIYIGFTKVSISHLKYLKEYLIPEINKLLGKEHVEVLYMEDYLEHVERRGIIKTIAFTYAHVANIMLLFLSSLGCLLLGLLYPYDVNIYDKLIKVNLLIPILIIIVVVWVAILIFNAWIVYMSYKDSKTKV